MNDSALNPIIIQTGWILVHFTWQAALLGIMHKLLLKQAWADTPRLRYNISLAALLLLIALPLVTALQLDAGGHPGNAAAQLTASSTDVAAVPQQAVPVATAASASFEARIMPWLVGGWMVGVIIYALRFLLGFIGLRRIIRRSSGATLPEWLFEELDDLRRSLGISQRVRLATSTMIESPMVTGWLLPMILLPVCATTRLTPAQLRMTLLHELAHVRRNDYLVNILQVIVETLFFFHPVAHQVSRSLRLEREKCCDDVVTQYSGNHLAYARLLTELELLRQPPPGEWALGIASATAQGELTSRVRRIVGVAESVAPARMNWPMLLPLLIIATLLGVKTTLPVSSDRIRHAIELPVAEPTPLPAPISAREGETLELQARDDKADDIPPVAASKTTPHDHSLVRKKATYKQREPVAVASMTSTTDESSSAATGIAMPADEEAQNASIMTPLESDSVQTRIRPEISGGRLLSTVQPDYPRYALQHGVEGRVTLGFTVGRDGRVSNVEVIAAEPNGVFDRAAVEAIRQWRFEPFMLNGQPTAHDVRQTLDFSPRSGGSDEGLQRDCMKMTGSRLCRSEPVRGANVVTYTGDTTVGY